MQDRHLTGVRGVLTFSVVTLILTIGPGEPFSPGEPLSPWKRRYMGSVFGVLASRSFLGKSLRDLAGSVRLKHASFNSRRDNSPQASKLAAHLPRCRLGGSQLCSSPLWPSASCWRMPPFTPSPIPVSFVVLYLHTRGTCFSLSTIQAWVTLGSKRRVPSHTWKPTQEVMYRPQNVSSPGSSCLPAPLCMILTL